jgi:hypothetical protein
MDFDTEPTRAWIIEEDNIDILMHITGKTLRAMFSENLGWVVVDDVRTYPRFKLLPRHTFNDAYPKLNKQLFGDRP